MVVLSEPAGLLNPRLHVVVEVAAEAVAAVVEAEIATRRAKNVTAARVETAAVSVLVGNV